VTSQVVPDVAEGPDRQPRDPTRDLEELGADRLLEPPEKSTCAVVAGERGGRGGLERPRVGANVEGPVGQMDAIDRGPDRLEVDPDPRQEPTDRLVEPQAHQGGRAGVERVSPPGEIPGAAAEPRVRLKQGHPQAPKTRQRRRR
jgi:hypothetical protein